MEEFREFRGYFHGNLLYTFPLHWVDNIKANGDVMIVSYYDEMQDKDPLVEIRVDEINIK
jgi:uncharacterized protein (DUF934 family)